MGRPRLSRRLSVFMNGESVGYLTSLSSGQLQFEYANSWAASDAARPISLSIPLGPAQTGQVVENFFDNLLPDSQAIKNRIQARFGADSNSSFDLLSYVGRDCVGALQLLPDGQIPSDVKTVHAEPLSEEKISTLLHGYRGAPLGMMEDDDNFRISIAGAQEKTALLWADGRWCKPLGVTPTTHIFKLPIGEIAGRMDMTDSVENEWLCHLILKAYSLPVANAEIGEFGDAKALIVERFDRQWSANKTWIVRLPQEDMCQALNIPAALKYENRGGPGVNTIMELLKMSQKSLQDRYNFFKAQMLFWMLAAIDGHAKNFSIFLERGGSYRMTPLYDVLSAHHLVANNQIKLQRLKMAMAVKGKEKHYYWERMRPRHWYSTASSCGFQSKNVNQIREELFDHLENVISEVSSQLPATFPSRVAEPIFAGMLATRDLFFRFEQEDS